DQAEGVKVVAYSCDTEPTPAVVHLASGADVLLHESSGGGVGHSSAADAGAMAHQAEVGRLMLIHYPTIDLDEAALIREAQTTFAGRVELAHDFQEIEL
ncbi:MAG TPA: MBL fold metallo-hydrolase, partial [Anaerolineales bacterium]|nr:MBL fold metallo-hydrolase [Anaerolineales bacterium]